MLCNCFIAGIVDTGGNNIAGDVDPDEQLIAGGNDTGDKHKVASCINAKSPQWDTHGLGGNGFMKKI